MDKRDLAILGLRLAAIYTWLQALGYFTNGIMAIVLQSAYSFGKLTPTYAALVFSLPILFATAGFLLFRFSQKLAERLLPDSNSKELHIPSGSRELAVIVFAGAGVVGFLMSLPKAIESVTRWFAILQSPERIPLVTSEALMADLGVILGAAFQLSLSFGLIIGARRFTEWWWHKQRLPQ